MTGAPEAALARELRMCLATIALVTDMDAGAEAEEAVRQQDVFALFAANTERLKAMLADVVADLPDPARLHVRHLGGRPRPDLRDPVKVLLTGSAGFIGSAIDRALTAAGDEVVRVDLMLPDAHGAAEAPEGTHRLDVRDATSWADLLRGVDAVCHQAALVGLGVRVADLPAYASHNDLGTAALLAAMHDAGVTRLVLASSMVVYGEGRYACPDHGPQAPGVRSEQDLRTAGSRTPARSAGRRSAGRSSTRTRRLDPRSSYAASKVAQEHYASAWARQAGGSVVVAALPQRLRPGDAPGHAVQRGRGDVPVGGRAGRGAPGLRGRRADARLRPRRRRGAGQRAGAACGRRGRTRRARRRTTSAPAGRSRSATWRRRWRPAGSSRR